MRRDYEDGMIDLIFYCIGSNFVDILGIVGMLEAAFNLLNHCQRLNGPEG